MSLWRRINQSWIHHEDLFRCTLFSPKLELSTNFEPIFSITRTYKLLRGCGQVIRGNISFHSRTGTVAVNTLCYASSFFFRISGRVFHSKNDVTRMRCPSFNIVFNLFMFLCTVVHSVQRCCNKKVLNRFQIALLNLLQ